MAHEDRQAVQEEWVTFKGGELEGKRPKALCPACREALKHGGISYARGAPRPLALARAFALARAAGAAPGTRHRAPLCFQCYRAELDRERALRAAGQLDTASAQRFQTQLPFEPVNETRLAMMKADRVVAREIAAQGVGRFVDKRRQAQIAARHALQSIEAGLRVRPDDGDGGDGARAMAMAIHAAELQLPECWLPFVVSR